MLFVKLIAFGRPPEHPLLQQRCCSISMNDVSNFVICTCYVRNTMGIVALATAFLAASSVFILKQAGVDAGRDCDGLISVSVHVVIGW